MPVAVTFLHTYARARARDMGLNRMIEKRKRGGSVTAKTDRPKCGAKTRVGGHCMALAVWDFRIDAPRNGRCRLHGGLSTGPRTEEGLRRTLEALKTGRARWLATRASTK